MLELSKFSIEETLLFSSPITELWSGHIQLINDLESANWGDSALQFQICDCRIVGCQSGGWVELKRSDSLVLITPALRKLRESALDLRDRCLLPPQYLHEAIAIRSETYTELRQLAPFPEFETLAPLQAWEATKLFQLEALNQILGNLGEPPKFDRDLILASSEGNFIEQADEIISLLDSDDQPVRLRKITERDRIISFYLDLAGIPQWKALTYDDRQYSLYLEPGYVIEKYRE